MTVIQRVATLLNIGHLDRLTQSNRAAVGLLGACDHAEQGRFTRTIAANNAHHRGLGNGQGQIFNQQLIAKALADFIEHDYLVAQAFPGGNIDFIGFVAGLKLLRIQLIKAGQTGFVFRLSPLGIWRTHSSSCLIARWREISCLDSVSSRLPLASSQVE